MNKKVRDHFFIVTGGPGMGKTAIIAALREQGHITVPETGREIIRQQVAAGGQALPWVNRQAFARLMFEQSLQDYLEQPATGRPVFFDRGIADTIGYLELCRLPVPEEMEQAAALYRYHQTVFLASPWKAIYEHDKERKQSFEEAVQTYESMIKVYSRLEYKLVQLPETTVAERAAFILDSTLHLPL
ncbi:putative ATPase [Chitinophaga sp. W3I9]|uniref:AAA family ATPase n=1 Tax=Chitinophaga sp. W3I9 TaxID=3373924 RepID=UPI003D22D30A